MAEKNAFEEFDNDCKKLDTAASLLEDLERNLKNETMKDVEELRNVIVNGSEHDIIIAIQKLADLKRDWLTYRDTKTKVVETLTNVTLSFLKKTNG